METRRKTLCLCLIVVMVCVHEDCIELQSTYKNKTISL